VTSTYMNQERKWFEQVGVKVVHKQVMSYPNSQDISQPRLGGKPTLHFL
jgi:hypothetical protein